MTEPFLAIDQALMGACSIGSEAAATSFPEAAGWLAAALTLMNFSMRSMVALRIADITANVCFIGYALVRALTPVLVLHLLLPLNPLRLAELAWRGDHRTPSRSWPRSRQVGPTSGNRQR